MTKTQFRISEIHLFKMKMLTWANRFNIFCFLDSNGYDDPASGFEFLLAAGEKRSLKLQPKTAFEQLRQFNATPSWLFGHIGYEFKNEVEELPASKVPHIDFGIGFFFEPEHLIRFSNGILFIESSTQKPTDIFQQISAIQSMPMAAHLPICLQPVITRSAYLQAIAALKEHIRQGDCYEINFCQHFEAKDASLDPVQIYLALIRKSANPFGALYKLNGKYCLCASPERYLRKEGKVIISQPIKGTTSRNAEDAVADAHQRRHLAASIKDRSENVMIVDLVRNDLSKICEEGSVHVEELFGIYSFPQVHQMISTIKGTMKKELNWIDALGATFPMGSMTGAPKKRVMELIDKYETQARGLFSGTLGYITPQGDFDFNVVIRSIFYDEASGNISCAAGGGITFKSEPEDEYEESLLKAAAPIQLLQNG